MAIDREFLEQLDRFSLIVRKRVTSKYSGNRKSIAFGRGLVFKEFRKYEPGDDFRMIDWRVFGRTDKLYIRKMEEERNLQLHVIVDTSKSMDYGKPTKYDYAATLGAGFAYLANKDNEKFQYATFSDTIDIFRPRRGRKHLASMIDHLNEVEPDGISKLNDAVGLYSRYVHSRSYFVIISDFLIDIDEIKSAIQRLKGHEVKVVQVLTPQERNLSIEGSVKLKDMESGHKMDTFISNRARSRYQRELDDHIAEIRKTCDSMGIDFFSVTTADDVFDVFFDVLNV